ncbi:MULTISPECIES: Ig-like domain-containing protein [unclassified Leifsonia]|uniref:Ig-like domain-containing protein n=1 Tax=unclassified Leifsonia TaxID=2663824 RepID=UPI0008A7D093|nr:MULTISPECIES: Ig-like domain-containing protein [unclassified Leifsonia]SEH56118.1 Fibronectin type III domain-containing protein [Leifsonia sp. CL154]SFL22919.1 Fibronectin type III domain-containing protein [Leifsonia sp. CL147]
MGGVSSWVQGRKTVASIAAIALIAGIPLTIAVLHKGFPVSAVNLDTRDVWVTNGEKLLGGRLNHQIDELDAAVAGSSPKLDVLQDGGAYFLTDPAQGTVNRIDPAFVSLVDKIQVPENSQFGYGANTLSVLSPDGRLWVLDAAGRLDFDKTKTKPTAALGTGARIAVSKSGTTFAVSPEKKALYTVDHPGAAPAKSSFPALEAFQLTAVGDQPVVLDTKANDIVKADGSRFALPAKGVRLQQPSDGGSSVVVAGADGLMTVPLAGGDVTEQASGAKGAQDSSSDVSAPVRLGTCSYGAWSSTGRYLYACDGRKPVSVQIDQSVTGDALEFRVNHGVIALNNLRNGNAWVVSSDMRLVQNWAQVKPNDTTVQGTAGQEKPVQQSYADTLAQRSANNRPPVAVNDQFGVRPGRTTLLPVLANDSDPDGDILTITDVPTLPPAQGRLDLVEGDRSIQFTPADGSNGTISFRYSISDGRGGTASAQVDATIRPIDLNAAPVSTRTSNTQVELGQSISYNVLNDWIDPDGDDIYLVGAASTSGDSVQFSPDGTITFLSTTGQTGSKEVTFTVSDGRASATGSLLVTVKPSGSLDPIAVPDSATAFVGQPVTIKPLANDVSPSGDPLTLVGIATDAGSGLTATADATRQTVGLVAATEGTYYATYTLGAGAKSTKGLIRVDVSSGAAGDAPPIAVKDVAYLRPGEPVDVPVLDNDVSPVGRVLVLQSVKPADPASGLNIEVLANSIVRITSPTVLPAQAQLSYTVSDGYHTASAGITVVPIPPLVVHQPPIAVDDVATVRAGDIATVPVLANDYSPDKEPFTLDPALVKSADMGNGAAAFVSGKNVRYQAPDQPGQYSVTYGITDKFKQTSTATVTFVVLARGGANDRAPEPQALTGRAFAGSFVTIDVPLDGIDPDGDSVSLAGIATQPTLGRISATSSTSFTYDAYPGSAGTDSFTYKVVDTYGKTATGTVRIGVVKRPDAVQPPIAVNDTVEVKPGKVASVPVLANDSDPNGYTIALAKKLVSVEAPLKARVAGQLVLVDAPGRQGAYLVRYQIGNGQGGVATAYIQVIVTPDAKPVYPTAVDQVVEPFAVAGKSEVKVAVLDGAVNPSGVATDLKIGLAGPHADAATVGSDGTVTVRPGSARMAISYTLTDPSTGLAGEAFIVVPPKGDASAPPHLKNALPEQIVATGATKSWNLSDIVDVPSGRPIKITGAAGVTATNASVPGYVDSHTIQFAPKAGYRGPASVTFEVNDGRDPGQSKDRVTALVLPITVGDPDQADVPPTFTPPNVTVQPGEAPVTVDLRASSYHPNPAVLNRLTYSGFSGSTSAITATPSGSTLSVAAPLGALPGTSTVIRFTVTSGALSIPGSVNVKVVSSSRPLATQKNPPQTSDLKRGMSYTLAGASGDQYWVNPFPGTPLVITDAKASSAPAGVTVGHTANSITVTATSGASIGSVNVVYHLQDATKDPNRTASTIGQYQVTIHDVPATMAAPGALQSDTSDSSVKVSFSPPANNGKAITQYKVTAKSGGGGPWTFTSAGKHQLSGLTNGTGYSFVVQAENADGWSAESPVSNTVTPYGTPARPTGLTIANNSTYAPSTFTLSWDALTGQATGGGAVDYEYTFDGSPWTNVGSRTTVTTGQRGAGTYSFWVRAVNRGSGQTGPQANSASRTITDPPQPSPSAAVVKGAPVQGMHYLCGSYANAPAGTYTVTGLLNGSSTWANGTSRTVSISNSGTVCLDAWLGKRNGDTIQMRFSGPKTFTGTTNNWDTLPVTSNHY